MCLLIDGYLIYIFQSGVINYKQIHLRCRVPILVFPFVVSLRILDIFWIQVLLRELLKKILILASPCNILSNLPHRVSEDTDNNIFRKDVRLR